jgi:diguanylate cyclase (GGDEF)-like protein/PAS domain S-box-containing protein
MARDLGRKGTSNNRATGPSAASTPSTPSARFGQVLDGFSQSAILIDPSYRLIYANEAAEQLLGMSGGQMSGHLIDDLAWQLTSSDGISLERNESPWIRVLETRVAIQDIEYRIIRPDGSIYSVLANASLLRDDRRQAIGVIVSFVDITGFENTLETVRSTDEYDQSLLRLYPLLGQAGSYSAILAALVSEIPRMLGYNSVGLMLADEDLEYAKLLMSSGPLVAAAKDMMTLGDRYHVEDAEEQFLTIPIKGDPFSEECALATHMVVVDDARTDPRTDKNVIAVGQNRTIINVPLMLAGERLGLINTGTFGDEGVRPPTQRQIEYLEAMANHTAVAMDRVRFLAEQREAEDAIERMAYYDSLTGLPNRSLFLDRLTVASAHAKRDRGGLAVMLVDVDNFKNTNDTIGPAVGDELLQAIAARLEVFVRDTDTVARLGGDEFALILPGVRDEVEAETVAAKLLAAFQEPFALAEHTIYATASIGITQFTGDERAEQLLRHTDTAMYRAKELGKNSYQFFSPALHTDAVERFELTNQLRFALERGELSMHYQPIFRVVDRKIVGAEALMRWNHPTRGAVPPTAFIPLAEETGWIITLGEWALRCACEQSVRWAQAGFDGIRVSVNLSQRQFLDPHLVDTVKDIIDETGVDPCLIELEITESLAMRRGGEALAMLQSLRDLGISIAIDDFGTGYSSLDHLRRFPIHTLKVDRTFVKHVCDVEDDGRAIATAIIVLARTLGLNVVAEGVEEDPQLAFLAEQDCREAQGFICSPAVPADDFLEMLERDRG